MVHQQFGPLFLEQIMKPLSVPTGNMARNRPESGAFGLFGYQGHLDRFDAFWVAQISQIPPLWMFPPPAAQSARLCNHPRSEKSQIF
ncbi:MAG TPA: hypothetical protein DEF45_06525 [Rhodopirellula sp.]|nr:hypothetical protein [Rhodopirellula sp.]